MKQKDALGKQADSAITAAAPAGTVDVKPKAKKQKPARPAEDADGVAQLSAGAQKRESSTSATEQLPKAELRDASGVPAADADEPPRKRKRRCAVREHRGQMRLCSVTTDST